MSSEGRTPSPEKRPYPLGDPRWGIPVKMPWYERIIGGWTGDVLAWLAVRAKKRGDEHEFWHIYAAIVLGNSNHDEDWPCHLATVLPYLPVQPRGSSQVSAPASTSVSGDPS